MAMSIDRSPTGRSRGRDALIVALVVAAALVCAAPAYAEDPYDEARRLAFAGERDAARAILTELLEAKPEYWDARILMGRLYAWDKRYDEAREHLLQVVRAKPGYSDARSALVDVELWSDHPDVALAFLQEGLRAEPNHQGFLYKKAVAQKKLGDVTGAMVTLDQLNEVNPSHAQGSKMFRSLRVERMRNKVGLAYGYTDVDTLSNPWHAGAFQFSRRTGVLGSVILRVNFANRFGSNATQFEIDAYPKIVPGLYAYVNYGYSQSRLYPEHRVAGELYANLPQGIEVSAGFRRLQFAGSKVTIYTGTLAKYQGSWWLSIRPYITPKSVGTSQSYQLTVRRYFGNADSYLGVTAGAGSSPGGVADVQDLLRLDSRKVGFRFQKLFGDVFILKLAGKYGWEELIGGRERRQFDVGIGIERRF